MPFLPSHCGHFSGSQLGMFKEMSLPLVMEENNG